MAATESGPNPKLFFLLVICFCSLYFIIRIWSINERAAIPQILQKFTNVEKVISKVSNKVGINRSVNVSLSRKIAESMDIDVPLPHLPEVSMAELIKEEKRPLP